MKKPVVVVVLVLILFKISSFAQEAPYLGVFGGYTYPGGVFTDLHNLSYKPVNNAGVFAEFDRLDHLFMNTGIIYSQEESGPVTLSPEVSHPKDFTSNLTFNYLQIYSRLKWSYKIMNHVNVYYSAGLYGGYLLSGTYTENSSLISDTKDLHRGNAGLIGGVGLTFGISKIKVNLGADANYGFFYTMKDLPYKGQIYAAGLRTALGLSYPIETD